MLREIELDALHFCDRTSLERLQIYSRYLRNLVDGQAHSLPLRYIHEITASIGQVYYGLTKGDSAGGKYVSTPISIDLNPGEEHNETLFRLANNAFVHRLTFEIEYDYIHLPYALKANATQLQCQVEIVRLERINDEIDYDLIAFLGADLKPKSWETCLEDDPHREEEFAMLFAHNALRGRVPHLVYEMVESRNPAPDCIIPGLFDVNGLETCSILTNIEPRPWIRKCIEKFKTAERGSAIVPTVTLLHMRYEEASPLHHAVEPLGHPRRKDVAPPHSAFLQEWIKERHAWGTTTSASPVADVFVFENPKASKKLEVSVWTVETTDPETEYRRSGLIGLHYVFFLHISNM